MNRYHHQVEQPSILYALVFTVVVGVAYRHQYHTRDSSNTYIYIYIQCDDICTGVLKYIQHYILCTYFFSSSCTYIFPLSPCILYRGKEDRTRSKDDGGNSYNIAAETEYHNICIITRYRGNDWCGGVVMAINGTCTKYSGWQRSTRIILYIILLQCTM